MWEFIFGMWAGAALSRPSDSELLIKEMWDALPQAKRDELRAKYEEKANTYGCSNICYSNIPALSYGHSPTKYPALDPPLGDQRSMKAYPIDKTLPQFQLHRKTD
jgi:hypothetical protein